MSLSRREPEFLDLQCSIGLDKVGWDETRQFAAVTIRWLTRSPISLNLCNIIEFL
jgi:hypothetical protein